LGWLVDAAVCGGTMTLAESTRSIAGARQRAPTA
jgi:hypothetical protein